MRLPPRVIPLTARAAALLCSLLSCCALPAFALDPRRPVNKYAHDVWQDKDGLPQNSVLAIAQTKDGYLWLGTEVGLVRFDGVRFVTFDKKNTPEIRHNHVTALCAGRGGELWVGTRGGLVRHLGGKFTAYGVGEGLAGESVRSLYEDAEGQVWVGTGGGLSRFRDGRFVNYTRREGLSGNNVRAILRDREGRLWVATSEGVTVIRDDKFSVYTAADGLSGGVVRAITEDAEGGVWIGTEGGGLSVFRGGKFRRYTTADGLSSDLVRSLRADRDGQLWVGTDAAGLSVLRGGKFFTLTTADGLSGNVVRAIYEDAEGSVWVGTEGGGLNRLRDGRVVTYTTRDGLSNDFIRAVREDSRGNLWVGTEGGGLNRLRGGRVTVYTVRDGLPSNFITALHEDARGDLWIGTESVGGLTRFDGKKFKTYSKRDGLAHSSVWAIHEARGGGLWIGTGGALNRFRDGRFETYSKEDGLPSAYVLSIHEDRAGTLWVGTRDAGLLRLAGGRFVPYPTHEGERAVTVTSFHEDADGALWVGTDAGLVRVRGESRAVISVDDGLFNDNIFQVLEDEGGRLWMSSSKGVFHVSRRELNDFADGAAGRVNSVAYTTADGMKSAECTGHAQPAGWRARDGRLWFPTVRGVVSINPRDATYNRLPPPVHLEQIILDGQPLDAGGRVSLPPDARGLELHYTGLSFVAPEKVRFKYRLEGFDDGWVEAGARRVAYYPSLPPGGYRFRVIASNSDGVWNEAGASIAFDVRPHFYQTVWFYGLCALGLGLAVLGMHRLRVRQVRREFAAVLAERSRVARELHDTLLQGFAGTALQLNAISHTLEAAPRAAKRELDRVLDQVDTCLSEARRAVSRLRSPAPAGSDLADALSKSALQLTAGTPVRPQLKVSGAAQRLPARVERNLLRIGQEAVANAVKHARAREIFIELCFDERLVRLRARDDGRGFDEREARAARSNHFGLVGMRERAEVIGGQFALRSAPGEGTEVVVSVPLK
jgi:ligand-binding sensor domain-containing protein/signal transduction histidine kinase